MSLIHFFYEVQSGDADLDLTTGGLGNSLYWGYIRIMQNKMETRGLCRGYIGA